MPQLPREPSVCAHVREAAQPAGGRRTEHSPFALTSAHPRSSVSDGAMRVGVWSFRSTTRCVSSCSCICTFASMHSMLDRSWTVAGGTVRQSTEPRTTDGVMLAVDTSVPGADPGLESGDASFGAMLTSTLGRPDSDMGEATTTATEMGVSPAMSSDSVRMCPSACPPLGVGLFTSALSLDVPAVSHASSLQESARCAESMAGRHLALTRARGQF